MTGQPLLPPGPAVLTLEVRQEMDYVAAKFIDVTIPVIPDDGGRHRIETGRDLLRAFLRHQMDTTVRRSGFPPATFRIRFAGETVIDCWDGRALVGCVNNPHAAGLNCGMFACPYP